MVADGQNEYEAARDIIVSTHKTLFDELNAIKKDAGINEEKYVVPGKPDLKSVQDSAEQKREAKKQEAQKKAEEKKAESEKKRIAREKERAEKKKEKEEARKKEKEEKAAIAAEKKKKEKQDKKDANAQKSKDEMISILTKRHGISEKAAQKIIAASRAITNNELLRDEIKRIIKEDKDQQSAANKKFSELMPGVGGEKEVDALINSAEQPPKPKVSDLSERVNITSNAIFLNHSLKETTSDNAQFAIFNINDDTAEIAYVGRPINIDFFGGIARFANDPYVMNIKRIDTIKAGKVKKENGKWKIVSQMVIKFVDSGIGTSTGRDPGVVSPQDEDIAGVEDYQSILAATADIDGRQQKEMASSARRTVGEVRKEFEKNGNVVVSDAAMAALTGIKEVKGEGRSVNQNTYLFDILTDANASPDQRGVAAALILAHRVSAGNSFLANTFNAARKSETKGKKDGVVKIIYRPVDDASLITAHDDGSITINAYKLGRRVDEFGGENRFFSWAEMAMYEEVLHLSTFKVASTEEISQVGRELTQRERDVVESIYGSKLEKLNAETNKMEPDYYALGLEYIRMMTQTSMFGTSTELLKPLYTNERSAKKTFFAKLLRFLNDIFSLSRRERVATEVMDRLDTFLGRKDKDDQYKKPEQIIAEGPKYSVFASPKGQKPVYMLTYKNRQYLLQEGRTASGPAWFEVQKMQDGFFAPVNDGSFIPGYLGTTYREAIQTLLARGGKGYGVSKMEPQDDDDIDRLAREIFDDLMNEYSDDSDIKGDPIKEFKWVYDELNVIIQDFALTEMNRGTEIDDITLYERKAVLLKETELRMFNIVEDVFAKNTFDDAIGYVIKTLKDTSLDIDIRGQLVKIVKQKLRFTHPDIVNYINERIEAGAEGLATSAAKALMARRLMNVDETYTPEDKPKKPKRDPKQVDMDRLFKDNEASQEVMYLLEQSEDGREMVKAMKEIQRRLEKNKALKDEEVLLVDMAAGSADNLSEIEQAARQANDLVNKMYKEVRKFKEEDKEAAEQRLRSTRYQMMARRKVDNMRDLAKQIKASIKQITERC